MRGYAPATKLTTRLTPLAITSTPVSRILRGLINFSTAQCPSSTQLGEYLCLADCHLCLCLTFCSRSMTRAQRAPKRAPTPTSATFSQDLQSNAAPPPPLPSKPLYLCSPFVEAALVKGNFKTIVMLPKYVDIMEWVAVNSAFFIPHGGVRTPFDADKSLTSIPISMSSTASSLNAARSRTVKQCLLVRRMSIRLSRFPSFRQLF